MARVARVAFEVGNPKSLDDVAVYYEEGVEDPSGYPLIAEYYQAKFHVDFGGALTWRNLINPAFIHASTYSLLQRVHAAQRELAPDGRGCRFILYSPWGLHPCDDLAKYVSPTDGSIRWSQLAAARPGSRAGRMRRAWREHLGLATDEELECALRTLRFQVGPTLDELQRQLNVHLRNAGLAPVREDARVNAYDDLYRKLLQAGVKEFSRPELEAVCQREGLWRGRPLFPSDMHRLAIRTFQPYTEGLEDEADAVLCLTDHFDRRYIKDEEQWATTIFPTVSHFLREETRRQRHVSLRLPAHISVAFAVGYCLESKTGVSVSYLQPTPYGIKEWKPTPDGMAIDYPAWERSEEGIESDGSEVAIALSVSHNVFEDVRAYITQNLPGVSRIICYTISPGPSDTVVGDGNHAKRLAQQLSDDLKGSRTAPERACPLHIFAAAPNGLLFFIGQNLRSFGRCIVYEYDLERNTLGAYAPSLTFPPDVVQDLHVPPTSVRVSRKEYQ